MIMDYLPCTRTIPFQIGFWDITFQFVIRFTKYFLLILQVRHNQWLIFSQVGYLTK